MSLRSTRRVPSRPSRPSQSLDKTICSTVILLLLLLSLPVSCSLKSPPKAPQPRVGKQCNVLRCTYAAKVKVNFGQEDRVTYYHLPASPLLFCLSLALFLFDKKHTILLSLHPLFPNLLDLSPSSWFFVINEKKSNRQRGRASATGIFSALSQFLPIVFSSEASPLSWTRHELPPIISTPGFHHRQAAFLVIISRRQPFSNSLLLSLN
jgi:hypothetical protein